MISEILQKYGIKPQKRFGQNFLVNMGVIEKITSAVFACPSDNIIEIGPGIGVMTRILANTGANIIAVDADSQMIKILHEELGQMKNVKVVQNDILKFEVPPLPDGKRYKVVGNIPYNISSPILIWLADNRDKIEQATLTMQREVANRITAKSNCKDYGALTIAVQTRSNAYKLFDIQPGSFWPAPKVTSSTVQLEFTNPPPYDVPDYQRLRNVVRAAFQKRRKMLRGIFPEEFLVKANIEPTARPDALSIAEFIRLAEIIPNNL